MPDVPDKDIDVTKSITIKERLILLSTSLATRNKNKDKRLSRGESCMTLYILFL